MTIVKVQKIPHPQESVEDILATFCYYFPQYTFYLARQLPYKRIKKMLNVVRKEKARDMYILTQVVASPNTKDGSGVKKMLEYLEGIINEK